MYAVINMMNGTRDDDGERHGKVESRHRTIKAAVKADAELQRAAARANGPTCFIPTTIVELRAEGGGIGHGYPVGIEALTDAIGEAAFDT